MKLTDKFQMKNILTHLLHGIFATLVLIAVVGCSRRIDYMNIPTPIVAIGDTIYIPSEYNLLTYIEDNPDAVFFRQVLK